MCGDKTETSRLMKEININIKLTKLDQKYSQYFIKLYGYFMNEPISSYFGAKTAYKYIDIITDNIESCIFPTKNLQDNCEMYLLLEGGEMDLDTYIDDFKDNSSINESVNLFFELLDFYKVSEYFIKIENKFFIHCDIKPPNLVIVKEKEGNKKIKFIDFGLSNFITNFVDPNSYGTYYMYEYLLTYDDVIYTNLIHASPLTDIYIVLQSCFEVIIRGYYKPKFTYNYRHRQMLNTMSNILKLITDIDVKIKLKRMMILADIIYNFYQQELKKYHEDAYIIPDYDYGQIPINKEEHPTDTRNKFLRHLNITKLKIEKPIGFTHEPPQNSDFVDYSVSNITMYNYLDKIMQYILHDEFNPSESVA